jgi:hypothetical protein
MSSKRDRSPPRTPTSTKRGRTASTPDTASTIAYGSVKTESTAIGSQLGSPTNESYMTPSVSLAHDSLQVSRGKNTPTTVPHSLYDIDGSYKYSSSGIEKSSDGVVSPMTLYSPQSRKRMRSTGGKKTRYMRKNKDRRTRKSKRRRA